MQMTQDDAPGEPASFITRWEFLQDKKSMYTWHGELLRLDVKPAIGFTAPHKNAWSNAEEIMSVVTQVYFGSIIQRERSDSVMVQTVYRSRRLILTVISLEKKSIFKIMTII